MCYLSTLLIHLLLPFLLATPVPGLVQETFGLDSVHLVSAPGLPPLGSLPGITIADLLEPPSDFVFKRGTESANFLTPRNPILPRQRPCIPAEFPLIVGEPSSYMWEELAVRVVYNYLRLLGKTKCEVPPEGVMFVQGHVNGHFVQVMGVRKEGLGDPGSGKSVASYCEHVALGMGTFMARDAGCRYPSGTHEITGGAATAWGNGDLWVFT